MALDLSKFNDYFGLFGALNLAYATSEKFRDIVDFDILKLKNVKRKKSKAFQKLRDIHNMLDDRHESVFRERFEAVELTHKKAFRLLDQKAKMMEGYTDGCKSIFLITALYCISMLVLSGYQDILLENEVLNVLFFFNLSVLFHLFVFIRSFTSKGLSRVKPIYTLGAFIILVAFSTILNVSDLFINHTYNLFSLNLNSVIAVTIAILPYVIHSVRALCHKVDFRIRYRATCGKLETDTAVLTDYIDNVIRDFTYMRRAEGDE